MASAARGRVDETFETYMLALAGLDQCPESAPQAVRDRLAANIERAERAFSDAAADGLQNGEPVDEAVQHLARANEASRAGFHDGKAIGALLDDLERATEHAVGVVRAIGG